MLLFLSSCISLKSFSDLNKMDGCQERNKQLILTGGFLGADIRQGADGPDVRGGGTLLLVENPISTFTAGTRHWGGAVTGGHGIGTCLLGG